MAYGPQGAHEARDVTAVELVELQKKWPVVWVNVVGLGTEALLRDLVGMHRLALEDVVNVGQRAKVEPYGEQVFVVARMADAAQMRTEQLSIFLGKGVLLTFQESSGDCFDGVRERIRHGKGIIRTLGADYLCYALLDANVDSYFPLIESIGDRLSGLEDEVLTAPDRTTAERIHETKRILISLRRYVWPHREMLSALERDGSGLVTAETRVYLRDVYDHAIQIIDLIESYREVSSDLMGLYLGSVSNKMNEVMKVLTIIATIFIPLSFIAGVYGMNFDPGASGWNMPELGWHFGYPFALSLMAASAGALLYFLWRRGWLR
jgi:magnesium transporter